MRLLHLPATILVFFFLTGCASSLKIGKQATTLLLRDSAVSTGQIGVCIYEPATNKYWYRYDATKYFIPASNTKLFTLYAGMKYLGDSLVGARVSIDDNNHYILPSGDPTFLNAEFKRQPLFDYLNQLPKNSYVGIINNFWKEEALGNGWAWNDYTESYMAERSMMPLYGNLLKFAFIGDTLKSIPYRLMDIGISRDFNAEDWPKFEFRLKNKLPEKFSIQRKLGEDLYEFIKGPRDFSGIEIPFKTEQSTIQLFLRDTLKGISANIIGLQSSVDNIKFKPIYSQPTDSLFKPMMHRSDNFFAEQTLLMASNEHLGYMNDKKIIDTILNKDLNDIPQRPKWVDGSGLSRYNLATPQSLVYLLNKMKNEFGLERMKVVLPTGGEGTLSSYYKKNSGFIYAKTGTLSNNCALSGYLITNKGKLLIFSVLANNYITGATPVRKAVEQFIQQLVEKN
jgi:serine-type D-Ala-D-Ala carboxypeptidase/endopeptidase (penicillin-binding protein 4)